MHTSNGYVLDDGPDRLGRLRATPDDERGDRDALWSRLRRQGYLFLPGFLDPADVRDFRRYYFDQLQGTGLIAEGSDPADGISDFAAIDSAELRRRLFGSIVPGSAYDAFCTQPAIRDWFGWMLDDDVHLHRRKILRHIRPDQRGIGTATQAHYDLVYLRGGTDRVLSIWIPLGDVPVQLGGLCYLEGSHTRVLAEEAATPLDQRRPAASMTADLPAVADRYDARWLLTDYAAGDVVVHSAHMIHASLDNVDPGGRVRLSTDIRYQSVNEPIDWRWQEHWHLDDGL